MKIKNIKDVEAFLTTVNKCNGDVILTSVYGDKLNLKSKLTQYIAIAKLLGEHGEEILQFMMIRAFIGTLFVSILEVHMYTVLMMIHQRIGKRYIKYIILGL